MSKEEEKERKTVATEFSYGVVPLRRKREDAPLSVDNLEVLLIEQKVRGGRRGEDDRQWCFPKGHRDFKHEPPLDCAKRELEEETNLRVVAAALAVSGHKTYASEYLNPVKRRWKRCEYWAAEVAGDLRLQASEVASARWFDSLDSAMAQVTHAEDRQILEQLKADLLASSSSSSSSSSS